MAIITASIELRTEAHPLTAQAQGTRPGATLPVSLIPVGNGTPIRKPSGARMITEKRTRKGRIFYGCSKYPKCTFASWDKPTGKRCPQCSETYLVEKNSKTKGHYLKCPVCKFEETS